jgi:hypothetical protein
MDEGFNTFINDVDTKVFNQGEFYEKSDIQKTSAFMFENNPDAIMTIPDVTQPNFLGMAAYEKPSIGLNILRKYILGKERFDSAFRRYIDRWAFKHPTPFDFFRTMENVGGEDLSYFWRGWFLTNSKLDQGITAINYENNDPAKGALITLVNNEQMVLPVPLLIEEDNGKTDSITLPVEIWQRGGEWTFHYPSTTRIKKITIDPDHDYPDINPSNNSLSGALIRPVPQGMSAADVVNSYLKAIGGVDKIKDIKDLSYTATGSVQGQEIKLVVKYKIPGMMYQGISLSSSNTVVQKTLVKGDSVIVSAMGQVRPLDSATSVRMKEQATPFPELNYSKAGYQLSLGRYIENIDGKNAYVLNSVSPSGIKTKEYFDASTGLKFRTESASENSSTSIIYGDYKEVSGILFPSKETISEQIEVPLTITDVKINSGLTEQDFK